MSNFFKKLYYTFPVQLLILQFRNHTFFLVFWGLMFSWITMQFGWDYGIPLLFVEPEYLNTVNFFSYSLLGMAIGSFVMSWNVTTYLLSSRKFEFLAHLQRPFAMFCLNNGIIPLAFYITYFISTINFQNGYGFVPVSQIALHLLGFISGNILVIVLSAVYFQSTNSNINSFVDSALSVNKTAKRFFIKRSLGLDESRIKPWRVDSYLSTKLQTVPARQTNDNDFLLVDLVFKQHHYNFLVVQMAILTTMVVFGYFVEEDLLQIPAGSSLTLFLALLIAVSGMFLFWTGKWSVIAAVITLMVINYSTRIGFLNYDNKAYGLRYDKRIEYGNDYFEKMLTPQNIQNDVNNTTEILENWKEKNRKGAFPSSKPKLVIITASGGGLTSALFTTRVLQKADSITGGKLMSRTALMTGVSGGIIGVSYFRELYYRKVLGLPMDIYDKKLSYRIARDLLNPICITQLTNDVFIPFRKVTYEGLRYRRDRGYMMEWQLNKNSGNLLNKKISDYAKAEKAATIPMMFHLGAMMNDYRRVIACSQPVRYMMRPYYLGKRPDHFEVDAIDLCSYLDSVGGKNLKLTSAIRMNATYPFILPSMTLPTNPETAVADGGARDNNASVDVFKFLDVFNGWIRENTSGVVIVQIKYYPKFNKETNVEKESFTGKFFSPLSKVYDNLFKVQDFNQDLMYNAANKMLGGKLKVIRFEYSYDSKDKKGPLSFHLSNADKVHVLRNAERGANRIAYKRLIRELND